jgi:hypothetical protein
MSLTVRVLSGTLLGAWCLSTAFAQTNAESCDHNSPKTRAEVKAELAAARAAGDNPLDWIHYPENAIRAGRIVAEQRAQAGNPCPR